MGSVLLMLLDAAIRIEKKVDELLKLSLAAARAQRGPLVSLEPLNYPTQGPCPLCQKQVRYVPMVLDDLGVVKVRVCGCDVVTNELPVTPVGGK